MNENQQLVQKIIDAIDLKVIDLEEKIKIIDKMKNDSSYIEDLSKVMSNDVIEFASTFYNFTEDAKAEFRDRLGIVFTEDGAVSYEELVQEAKNLYYLYEDGLLGTSAVEVQYRKSVECINKFRRMVERYIKNSQSEINDEAFLNRDMSKLNEIREYFDENGLIREVVDEDEFSREIYKLDLTSEEKMKFMFMLNDSNIAMFRRSLNESLNATEVIQEILEIDPTDKKLVVSEEVIKRIDELLNDPDVMNKVVAAMYDINDHELLNSIDKEEIEATKDMVRDDIIERLEIDEEINPQEAFDDIYKSISKDNSLLKLKNRLFNDDSVVYNMDKEEQMELLERSKIFYGYYKGLLSDIVKDVNNKQIYDNLVDAFTESSESREAIYKSKTLKNIDELHLLIAYELGIILRLVDSLDKKYYGKVMSRLKDLFDTYDHVYVNDYIKVGEMPKEDVGHLFFINSDCQISDDNLFTEDVNFGSKKGIPKQYYTGLLSALKGVKERAALNDNYKHGKYVSEPVLKDLRVRFRDANRTRVVYIPVGEKDAIILGARCRGYVESSQHDFSNRAKKMRKDLNSLIDIICAKGSDYDELVAYNEKVEQNIFNALIPQKNKVKTIENISDNELEEMMSNEEEIVDEVVKVK